MASLLLLPGYGGAYTSETFTATGVGADTLDVSRCTSFAVHLSSTNGAGTVQVQQTFNPGKDWQSLGSAITIASNGPVSLFGITTGPFGTIRLNVTITAGTLKPVTIVGFPSSNQF